MKKIFLFSLLLVIISAAASAQAGPGNRFRKQGQINRFEKMELRQDLMRTRVLKHRAQRDGVVTPIERRRIHRSQCDTRRDVIRFKHNGRRRVI